MEIAPKIIEEKPNAAVKPKLNFKFRASKHKKIPTASKNHATMLIIQQGKKTFLWYIESSVVLKSDGLFWNFFKGLVLFINLSNDLVNLDDLVTKVNAANTTAIEKIGIFSIGIFSTITNNIEKDKMARTSWYRSIITIGKVFDIGWW
jgi:hypothetical protein